VHDPLDHDPDGGKLFVGELRLCLARRLLIGPHGYAELDATLYALAELLMRALGTLVEDKALIAAMHRGITCAPGGAAPVLRNRLEE